MIREFEGPEECSLERSIDYRGHESDEWTNEKCASAESRSTQPSTVNESEAEDADDEDEDEEEDDQSNFSLPEAYPVEFIDQGDSNALSQSADSPTVSESGQSLVSGLSGRSGWQKCILVRADSVLSETSSMAGSTLTEEEWCANQDLIASVAAEVVGMHSILEDPEDESAAVAQSPNRRLSATARMRRMNRAARRNSSTTNEALGPQTNGAVERRRRRSSATEHTSNPILVDEEDFVGTLHDGDFRAAMEFLSESQYSQATKYFLASLHNRSNQYGPNSLQTAPVHEILGDCAVRMAEISTAIGRYQEALRIFRLHEGKHNHETTRIMISLADLHFDAGVLSRAITYYERALQLRTEILGDCHPDVSHVASKAVKAHIESARLHMVGRDRGMVIFHCRELLWLLRFIGTDGEACLPYEASLLKLWAKDDQSTSDSLDGQLDDQRITTIIPLHQTFDNDNNILHCVNVAIDHISRSPDKKKALPTIQFLENKLEAYVIQDADQTRDHASAAFYRLGRLSTRISQHDAAVKYLKRSLQLRQDLQISNDEDIPNILCKLAAAHVASGDLSQALRCYHNYREFRTIDYEADVLIIMGVLYSERYSPIMALDCYAEALSVLGGTQNVEQQSSAFGRLRSIVLTAGRLSQSASCYEIATDCRDAKNILLFWGMEQVRYRLTSKSGLVHREAMKTLQQGSVVGIVDYVGSFVSMGNMLLRRKEEIDALKHFEEALQAHKARSKARLENIVEVYTGLGIAHRRVGNMAKSNKFFQSALKELTKAHKRRKGRPDYTASFYSTLGAELSKSLSQQQQQQQQQRQQQQQQQQQQKRQPPSDTIPSPEGGEGGEREKGGKQSRVGEPDRLWARHLMGTGLCHAGQCDQAIRILEDVLIKRADLLGWDDLEVARIHADLIIIHTLEGDMHEARKMFVFAGDQLREAASSLGHPFSAQIRRFCDWRSMRADFLFSLE